MLVLARKENEEIVIGNQVVIVTVVAIEGGKVKLGFTAPPEIPIYRKEIWDKMQGPEGSAQS